MRIAPFCCQCTNSTIAAKFKSSKTIVSVNLSARGYDYYYSFYLNGKNYELNKNNKKVSIELRPGSYNISGVGGIQKSEMDMMEIATISGEGNFIISEGENKNINITIR